MQEMGGTMVAHGVFTALADHFGLHTLTYAQVTLIDMPVMDDQALQGTAGILHMEGPYRTGNIALVTDLTTTFSVEGGCIENDERLLGSANALNLFAIYYKPDDGATPSDTLIASELRRTYTLEYPREGAIIP